MTLVCGVDGCRQGWVSVSNDLASGRYSWCVVSSLRDLVSSARPPDVIAVDVPIGLPDSGARECDVEARRLLGAGRASSVFPAPIRPVLSARTHAEANAAREAAEGKRVSIQTWAIIPKIREVDLALRTDAALRLRVREVHPEVCFFFMADKRPMQHSKKKRAGREERRTALSRQLGPVVDRVLGEVRLPTCGQDDVLDAFAALWTAKRIVSGQAVILPAIPGHDRFGLPMEMVA